MRSQPSLRELCRGWEVSPFLLRAGRDFSAPVLLAALFPEGTQVPTCLPTTMGHGLFLWASSPLPPPLHPFDSFPSFAWGWPWWGQKGAQHSG